MNRNTLAGMVLILAVIIGYAYLLVEDISDPRWVMLAWKGAGVWLLAAYAAIMARSSDGWTLVIVLALAALGDVLVEKNLVQGGAAFALAWCVAIWLYRKHKRAELAPSQKLLVLAMLIGSPLISWLAALDVKAALYGLVVGAMAAAAWASRFPRYRTGLGAVLLMVSDWILFARAGPHQWGEWAGWAVWIAYFSGQILVATSVAQALAGRGALRAEDGQAEGN